MKQVFLSKGNVVTRNIIPPSCRKGCVLMATTSSCISAGTEMSGVNDSKKSLATIAKEKPKTAIKFTKMAVSRGPKFVANTIKNIRGSDFGKEMGYSAAGVIVECGSDVKEFHVGDHIAAVGTKVANHAAYNCVPVNLAIKIPEGVSDEDASTAALGGIAFEGVRRLSPNPGDAVVVMGLGLIGILTVKILLASGCKVLGIDINKKRLKEVKTSLGIDTLDGTDPVLVEKAIMLNDGKEYDGVIFTAATRSSVPMSSCFKMLRRRAVFVLSGVSGMEINREDIYAKELEFRMATSYGPGRYDLDYENAGHDYPEQFVRFTIQRNIEAYFNLLATGRITIQDIDRNTVSVENASEAFARLSKPNPPMLSIINYNDHDINRSKVILDENFCADKSTICYALIGTGGYASSMHLPNFSELSDKYQLKAIMNRSPGSAAALAYQYKAAYYTTDAEDIFNDEDIQMVMVCTRHNSHTHYALRALRAGKDVFVEKPAAINIEELNELKEEVAKSKNLFMVGYNRRFSKYIREIKNRVSDRKSPLIIDYSMCAGYIPYDNWVHNEEGGGRIVGEGCHIIDVCRFLTGSNVVRTITSPIKYNTNYYQSSDNVSFTLEYEDGSIATIRYISSCADSVPKESMRVVVDGAEIVLDNYTMLSGTGIYVKQLRSFDADKGQKDILSNWYNAIITRTPAIPFEEIYETTKVTFDVRNDTHS